MTVELIRSLDETTSGATTNFNPSRSLVCCPWQPRCCLGLQQASKPVEQLVATVDAEPGLHACHVVLDGLRGDEQPGADPPSSCPGSITTATPQSFTVVSLPAKPTGYRVDPTQRRGHALHPDPYPPDLSRWNSYGALTTDSYSYTFSSRLPDPYCLAVPVRPVVVRAASCPPRHLPDQTALSSDRVAATTRRRSPFTSARS
jgi:hypothetical protein